MEQPSKEEYVSWAHDKCTKWLVKSLFDKREAIKEGIAEQYHSDEYGRAVDIGRCQALRDAIDYIIKEFDFVGPHQEEV